MDADLKALTEATAGAVGGLLSTTLLYPLDTCKTKYQAEAKVGQSRKYRSMLDVLREAIAERQLISLYQGLHTKNFQSVLAGFVYFYSYSYVKTKYLAFTKVKQMGTGANLVVAALAGACTAIVTQVWRLLGSENTAFMLWRGRRGIVRRESRLRFRKDGKVRREGVVWSRSEERGKMEEGPRGVEQQREERSEEGQEESERSGMRWRGKGRRKRENSEQPMRG